MLSCFSSMSAKGTSYILFIFCFEIHFDIKHPGPHLEYHASKLSQGRTGTLYV